MSDQQPSHVAGSSASSDRPVAGSSQSVNSTSSAVPAPSSIVGGAAASVALVPNAALSAASSSSSVPHATTARGVSSVAGASVADVVAPSVSSSSAPSRISGPLPVPLNHPWRQMHNQQQRDDYVATQQSSLSNPSAASSSSSNVDVAQQLSRVTAMIEALAINQQRLESRVAGDGLASSAMPSLGVDSPNVKYENGDGTAGHTPFVSFGQRAADAAAAAAGRRAVVVPSSRDRAARSSASSFSSGYDYDGGDSSDDDVIVDESRSSYPGVRFQPPSKFNGKMDDAMTLRNFLSAMDRYLIAVGVDHKSTRSVEIASMQLEGVASNWFDQHKAREPETVRTWKQLKTQLKKRFEPVALEQIAFKQLLLVRYRTDISTLNHEFMKYLQMLPYFMDASNDRWLIQLYMNAITSVPGTNYISTVLRSAIQERRVRTLNDVLQQALLSEANLGARGGRGVVSSSTAAASYRPGGSSWSNGGSWRQSSSSSSRGFQQRSPMRSGSLSSAYQTPAKLNHVASSSIDEQDYGGDGFIDQDGDEAKVGADVESEMHGIDGAVDDQSSAVPEFHPDVTPEAWLHVMNFTAKAVKRFPSLSVQELDRRRRNGACFECGRAGHYARDCTKRTGGGDSSSRSDQPKKL